MQLREFYRHRMYGPYNVGPRRARLTRIEPELAVIEDAYATPREVGPDRTFTGALYDAAGEVVGQSVREGTRNRRQKHVVEERPDLATARVEPDEVVYLGPLMRHFGHFLLEVMPRLWALDGRRVRKVYFHPFRLRHDVPDFVRDTLKALAGPDVEIRLIEQPTRFARVLAPSPTFDLNYAGSPAFWDWCQGFAAMVAPQPRGPELVYVSRSRLKERNKRLTVNEAVLEAMFAARGFEILHPEQLPFFDQLARMRACRLLAGCSGSAMHQALFMPPNSGVACVDSRFTGSQHAVEVMGDHTALHFAALRELPSGDVEFDESFLPVMEQALDELLADWPARLSTPFTPGERKFVGD